MPQGPRGCKRSKTSICKCQSCCVVFNSLTHSYGGRGTVQSRNTRYNHTRDDRRNERATGSGSIPTLAQAGPTPDSITVIQGDGGAWIRLWEKELLWHRELPLTSPTVPLIFVNSPIIHGEYKPSSLTPNTLNPNSGLHTLNVRRRANAAFLSTENRLCELVQTLKYMPQSDEAVHLCDQLYKELNRLDAEKELQWLQQRAHLTPGKVIVNTESHFYRRGPTNLTSRASSVISLIMEHFFFTQRRALRTNLAGFQDILRLNGASPATIKSIPKDPRRCSPQFHLDPVLREFLSCPACHCLFPYNPGDDPNEKHIVSRCTYRKTPTSSVCDTQLWKEVDIGDNRTRYVPQKKYLHQVLKFWLGRLVSWVGIEDLLENYPRGPPADPNTPVHDIWLSKVFHALRDSKQRPFFPPPGDEGRVVFCLAVDSFNPFHVKASGISASSTGIWLVVLNLPLHIRYRPENVCQVGMIPDKPSVDEINHHLRLVVDDLLEFWDPGVYFSRTYRRKPGRFFKGMLVPLVADLLAARQVIGLPGSLTAHSFCTFCDLDHDDIDVLDPTEWPAKDVDHIRRISKLWKNADSEQHQQQIFEAWGLRWSALLDLPYWDPVHYTIIDSMHALDLGLLQTHCRVFFQIDTNASGGDGSSTQPPLAVEKRVTSSKGKKELSACLDMIRSNEDDMLYELLSFPRKVLYTVCVDLGIRGVNNSLVVGTKWVLAQNISRWRKDTNNQEVQEFIISSNSSNMDIDTSDLYDSDDPDDDSNPEDIISDDDDNPESEDEIGPDDVDEDAHIDAIDGTGAEERVTQPLPAEDGIDILRASRVIRHLVKNTSIENRTAFNAGSAAIFAYLCRILQVEHDGIQMGKKESKRLLFHALCNAIQAIRTVRDRALSYVDTPRGRVVLGKDVMEAVWADMALARLPTWLTAAPHNWGTKERGKLSADQWRAICTVHLPITLIRLWSNETGRKKAMLRNFMDLVNAIQTAHMRVTSQHHKDTYNQLIFRYVAGLKNLFPDVKLRPNHHVSLHIGDMLDLFGPTNSHNASFYERYIKFLHRINTNQKIGELESTYMKTAARSSNLQAILADDDKLRQTVIETVTVLETIEKEDIRGFRLASLLDPNLPDYTVQPAATTFTLDAQHYRLLCLLIEQQQITSVQRLSLPREALSINKISSRGVCYGTCKSSKSRDNHIIFLEPDALPTDLHLQKAGIIQTIFQYTYLAHDIEMKGFYLIVRELSPMDVTGGRSDPYREFSSRAFLCSTTATKLRVLSLSQVVSHFVLLEMSGDGHEDLILVWPVDRLMMFQPAAQDI